MSRSYPANFNNGLVASGVHVEILLPLRWWQPTKYRLLSDIECGGHFIPAGFVSDGASVSRWFAVAGLCAIALAHLLTPWLYAIGLIGILAPALFPKVGRYLKATLVHDYYLHQGVDRKTCDRHFKQCLEELGISSWRVNAMYFAVRVYGMTKTAFKNTH